MSERCQRYRYLDTTDELSLVYSPDDGGWYWQRFSDWAVTQLFRTDSEARLAMRDGKLEWGQS